MLKTCIACMFTYKVDLVYYYKDRIPLRCMLITISRKSVSIRSCKRNIVLTFILTFKAQA